MTNVSPSNTAPVPNPLETRTVTVVTANQHLTEEQRDRVCAWLRANHVDPKVVAQNDITVRYRVQGDRQGPGHISFTQYYTDESGHKVVDQDAAGAPVTLQRCVAEKVQLAPEPSGDADE